MPRRSNRNRSRNCFILPRDTRPGSSRWSIWSDLLTGKGPDMFVGRRADYPSRGRWSNWGHVFDEIKDDELYAHKTPFGNWLGDTDRDGQVYDFRTRRYRKMGREDMWSDVRYCPDYAHGTPLRVRNAYGGWHNMQDFHCDAWGWPTCWDEGY